jgi:hypothetical protein
MHATRDTRPVKVLNRAGGRVMRGVRLLKWRGVMSKAAAESVIERVYLTVETLATEPGDVRSRLKSVGIILAPLQAREFPENLRKDFEWIMEQLTRYDVVGSEGRIEATMNRIKNSTGEKIAKRIFALYSELQEMRGSPLL